MATGKTFDGDFIKNSKQTLLPTGTDSSLFNEKIVNELQLLTSSLREENISIKDAHKRHTAGHRKRVREKFSKQDSAHLSNLEIIEALLFFCNPRKDVKKEASKLHDACGGNMLKLLFLEEEKLKNLAVSNVLNNFIFLKKIIKEIISRHYKDKITEYCFKSTKEIAEYLMSRASLLSHEELRVLYLNAKSKLIDDAVVSTGTINETAIYIREVVAGCLKKAAVSIIISHNHPSGEVVPSREDIDITYNLKRALETVSVGLQDHIIVSQNKYFSFKAEGLL